MDLKTLKEQVWKANLELVERKLVIYTWGNVSGIDRERGLVVIKPSGVEYDALRPQDLVVLKLDGQQVEGDMRPSSDTPTHLALYRAFPSIGGVTHTHSTWATIWAQAGRSVPCYGTTHADYFYGSIPCTRPLTPQEIKDAYEANTGRVIIEAFQGEGAPKPEQVPAVVVFQHGPFTWGPDAAHAVESAVVLEQVAQMAWAAQLCNPSVQPVQQEILDKHYLRKHGPGAYYGQSK